MNRQILLYSCLVSLTLSGCITMPQPDPAPVTIEVLVDRVIEAGQSLQVNAAMFAAARRDRDAVAQVRYGLLIARDAGVILESVKDIRDRIR